MRVVTVKLHMTIDEKGIDRLKMAVRHRIGIFINLDSWPEIESIFGVEIEDKCDVVEYPIAPIDIREL
jgi:hypothetical protein